MSAICQRKARVMATISERDHYREQLLHSLYDTVEGVQLVTADYRELGEELEIPPDETEHAVRWLIDHGLVNQPAYGASIELTPTGIDEVEHGRREAAAAQRLDVLTADDQRRIEAVITPVQSALDAGELGLDEADEQDLRVQLDTIMLQLKADRPRRGVVRAALSAAAGIAVGVAGNAAWVGLLQLAAELAH